MKNRSPAWVTTIAQTLLLASLLPPPAVATNLATPPATSAAAGRADPLIARGKYLTSIAGCHDCHTEGYTEAGGKAPAERWFTGSAVGFKGPWGVSYPSNLRLTVQKMNESQWLAFARAPRLPPMPWLALREMNDTDLTAVYRYMRSIGPAGVAAPLPLAPGAAVKTPYVQMTPQNLPVAQR